MLKVSYPQDAKRIEVLEEAYVSEVGREAVAEKLSAFFAQPRLAAIPKFTLDQLLVMHFEELAILSFSLNAFLNDNEKAGLKLILNYDKDSTGGAYSPKLQPAISNYFMSHSQELNISTCHFCNIDYINAFKNIGDFTDTLNFINRANKWELAVGKILTPQQISLILNERIQNRPIINVNVLGLSRSNKNNLAKEIASLKNHFTLDHVLNKAEHPIAAISMYNFVPSCYSCNSKFKGSFPLVDTAAKNFLSPTSAKYAFSENVKFKLRFNLNSAQKYEDINSINDFVVDFDIKDNQEDYETYLVAFKIRGRYAFHKYEILSIINKRKCYSDARLMEIADVTKFGFAQVKRDIFGEEILDDKLNSSSLIKLKQDIAEDLGIR